MRVDKQNHLLNLNGVESNRSAGARDLNTLSIGQRYFIKKANFSNGEDFPLVIDGLSGSPVFETNIYLLTNRRVQGLAYRTLKTNLGDLIILLMFLQKNSIDLNERFKNGVALTLSEIGAICDLCGYRMGVIRADMDKAEASLKKKVINLESVRLSQSNSNSNKVVTSKGTRIANIRDYIVSSANYYNEHYYPAPNIIDKIAKAAKRNKDSFNAHVSKKIQSNICRYPALRSNEAIELLELVRPDAPQNPWRDEDSRYRNQLIFHLLFRLGIRLGELAKTRISEINFQKHTLIVTRTPDCPLDKRSNVPSAKTLSRELALERDIVELLIDYVINWRCKSVLQDHDYLIVAHATGSALTLEAIQQIIVRFCKKNPTFPAFRSHTGRRTWNEEFSLLCTAKKIPPEKELRMRNAHMGWKPNSDSSHVYLERSIREDGQLASLELQKLAFRKVNHD